MSNAPHNPADVEVDEPTQPYSRAKIARLRRVAKAPVQEQRLDAERPEVTHVSARGMLTVVADDGNEDAGDPALEGWFALDGRWLRVCIRCFEHFGFSGAPPGMIGAVDASFASGTIDGERSEVEQAPAPKLKPEASQPSTRRHKWKLWVLVPSPLVLALAAWVFARNDVGPVQPMTRDTEQVREDAPSQPTKERIETPIRVPTEAPIKVPTEVPAEVPTISSSEPEITPRDEPPNKPNPRKDFGACVEHRKSAMDAKDGGDWARLLDVASRRRNCWSRVSANALQMEALFELGRYRECVELGARDGSKKEIQRWRNACQLNL